MAIDFSKAPEVSNNAQPVNNTSIVQQPQQPEQYDIVADRQQMTAALANSPEIDKLTSEISIHDMTTIVNFGGETANQIARVSDSILQK